MPTDGLSQLARALLVSQWGHGNLRGDQDVTPGFDASQWSDLTDPRMEQMIPGDPTMMELDPQPNVDRWLGILLDRPRRI